MGMESELGGLMVETQVEWEYIEELEGPLTAFDPEWRKL